MIAKTPNIQIIHAGLECGLFKKPYPETLTYTALGLVVAAAGLQFQAALQHPYVLIGLAIVFTLLAMSMFGYYQNDVAAIPAKLIHLFT